MHMRLCFSVVHFFLFTSLRQHCVSELLNPLRFPVISRCLPQPNIFLRQRTQSLDILTRERQWLPDRVRECLVELERVRRQNTHCDDSAVSELIEIVHRSVHADGGVRAQRDAVLSPHDSHGLHCLVVAYGCRTEYFLNASQ